MGIALKTELVDHNCGSVRNLVFQRFTPKDMHDKIKYIKNIVGITCEIGMGIY